jgi:hypothetical protein
MINETEIEKLIIKNKVEMNTILDEYLKNVITTYEYNSRLRVLNEIDLKLYEIKSELLKYTQI